MIIPKSRRPRKKCKKQGFTPVFPTQISLLYNYSIFFRKSQKNWPGRKLQHFAPIISAPL
jgi:hypothetical protein